MTAGPGWLASSVLSAGSKASAWRAASAGLAIAAITAAAAAQPLAKADVPMRAIQVGPHSYYVQGQAGPISTANQGFNSNAGFVVTREGVVVFDALGTPALGARLRQLIGATTRQPIRRVIVSHYHADHVYGLQALAPSGVEIWAHALVRDYLAGEAPAARLAERRSSLAPWVDATTRVVAPTRYLGADTRFSLGGLHFQLVHAGPAHTPEDLMMVVEEDKVLYAGDLMFTGRVPFVGDADVGAWIGAIDRVLATRPQVVVGGHGPSSPDAAVDLAQTRDYLAYLRSQIGAAYDEGLDFDSAYRRIDWSRFAALPAFEAANRRNAYQAWLNVERDALKAARSAKP